MRMWTAPLLLMSIGATWAADIECISVPLIPDVQRAEIYVLKMTEQPVGLLILCPGCNGNGREWLTNPAWQTFAHDNSLDLVGLSFASDVSLLKDGRGYYYAHEGSGQLLLDGIRQVYHRDLPFLMYGFSGGAHFVSGFEEWRPDLVMGWCAYSAEWWDKPVVCASNPPGIVLCGENDERLGPSLIYFKQGRAVGKPWLWLCAPDTGHSIYGPAEKFVRQYFASIIAKGPPAPGVWVDVDQKMLASRELVSGEPSITGWLPNSSLLPMWKEIHQP